MVAVVLLRKTKEAQQLSLTKTLFLLEGRSCLKSNTSYIIPITPSNIFYQSSAFQEKYNLFYSEHTIINTKLIQNIK
jgi:hypothetical protein